MTEPSEEHYMRAALLEARKGIGHVSPNPAVGAILVKKNKIISTGYHQRRGLPHAETECLAAAGDRGAKGATLYVTLEPCSTTGRTPPCTRAIMRAGLRRVVIGAIDPNPLHAGRAVSELRAAGIEVSTGLLVEECTRLNEAFNKWILSKNPFVIAKCGMSIDGRLTRPPNESRWLTSATSRRHAHRLRAKVDAILIGAETVRQDDPRLTTRGTAGARQPWRVVVSRSGKISPNARLLSDRFASRTLIYKGQTLREVLADLGEKEITSVLIEGGGKIFGEAFDARLVDKVQFYIAPLFVGGPIAAVGGTGAAATAESSKLGDVRYERIGSDLCVSGYPQWAAE
jgi:diaminohydroxyphosphoribosylaminopyrimidine deaminase/5-amino-6-(5-phosphoribosylamino)uracil reductase